MKRFALLTVVAIAAFAAGWTSAGDVKVTGTLFSKIQQFYGTTGTNFVRVPDNVASALIIEDSLNGGDLMTITTTNGSEKITYAATAEYQGTILLNNVGISGTLGVTGASTFRSTMDIAGAVGITGAATLRSTLGVAGALGVTGAATLRSTLNVGGAAAISGAVTVQDAFTASSAGLVLSTPIFRKTNDAVTAAGSDKTDCTQLTSDFNVVAGTWPAGVCLPAATNGRHISVITDSNDPVMVYPLDSHNDSIDIIGIGGGGLGTDVGFAIGLQDGRLDCDSGYDEVWFCTYHLGGNSFDFTATAAGTNQGTFTALSSAAIGATILVSGANGTAGVTLPNDDVATCIGIRNLHASSDLKVTGHNSDNDAIDGLAADASVVVRARATNKFCTADGTNWFTL